MAAATTPSQVPEITVISRVASIPLVASSLDQLNNMLEKSMFTRSPYHAAQSITQTAYSYSQPIQIRLASLIVHLDGFANKSLDMVESKYPYPFQAKPEEVADYVRERRQSIVSSANKTFDKTVKTPAIDVAEGIDKKLTPIVNYFEIAVNKVGSESSPSSPSSTCSDQYQIQRAFNISKTLKGNIQMYSSEHFKQLQQQHVLVQRATETANNISALASSGISSAQNRIHSLSDNMVSELQKIQQTTTQLPQTFQNLYPDMSKAVAELRGIVADSDLPVTEKVNRVGKEVKERVSPLLENFTHRIGELLASKKEDVKGSVQESTQDVNGSSEK